MVGIRDTSTLVYEHHILIYTGRSTFSKWDEKRTVFTARKRSLGKGNVFTCMCHSVHGRSLFDVTSCLSLVPFPFQGDLCPGGLCPGESLSGGLPRQRAPTVKSRRYASYWNAFLFRNKLLLTFCQLETHCSSVYFIVFNI